LAVKFRDALNRQKLTRYTTQKVLELSPAVTQGFDANVVKYLKHQAGRVQNPWFKPMIFVPSVADEADGDDTNGGMKWQCLPLCEENLPEATRRLVVKPGGSATSRTKAAPLGKQLVDEAHTGALAGESEDDDDDDKDTSDANHGLVIEAAVHKFLRGIDSADDAVAINASEDAALAVPRKPTRRGGRRRGDNRLRVQ